MKAAFWGETEVVAELVKGGADLNLQNEVCLLCIPHWHTYVLITSQILLYWIEGWMFFLKAFSLTVYKLTQTHTYAIQHVT